MFDNLCKNCFSEKGNSRKCPICGFDESKPKPTQTNLLQPGTILHGRYICGKVLGQGGFGITYLAYDAKKAEKIAIKEFFPSEFVHRSTRPGNQAVVPSSEKGKAFYQYGLTRFREEAELLRSICRLNPGIIQVFDAFSENDTGYFVMEYVDGKSFKDLIQQHGHLDQFSEASDVMLPVMDALDCVHQHQLIHRDVSPDNIYQCQNGQVKLLDFGSARYYSGEHSNSLTVVLKPGYAPFEQYLSHGDQGPWTDVYAAAATFYYALTGIVPPDAMSRKTRDTLIRPSALNRHITRQQNTVILNGLAIKPENRYRSMDEFSAAVRSAAAGNLHVEKVTVTAKEEEKPETHSRFHLDYVKLLLLTAIILFVVAIFLLLSN